MSTHLPVRGNAPDPEAVKTALALIYDNPDDAESVAAAAGIPVEMLLAALGTEEGIKGALVRREELIQSGELVKRRAVGPLLKLLAQIETLIDAGEVSASAAPKLAETLLRLTGLSEERAARLRVQAPERPLPTIYIRHGDDPVPEHPGRDAIVIRLPHRLEPETPIKDVLDAEEINRD